MLSILLCFRVCLTSIVVCLQLRKVGQGVHAGLHTRVQCMQKNCTSSHSCKRWRPRYNGASHAQSLDFRTENGIFQSSVYVQAIARARKLLLVLLKFSKCCTAYSTYIHRVPQCVPSPEWNKDSPTPSLACWWGVGGVPIPTTGKKLSTLPTLCCTFLLLENLNTVVCSHQ